MLNKLMISDIHRNYLGKKYLMIHLLLIIYMEVGIMTAPSYQHIFSS